MFFCSENRCPAKIGWTTKNGRTSFLGLARRDERTSRQTTASSVCLGLCYYACDSSDRENRFRNGRKRRLRHATSGFFRTTCTGPRSTFRATSSLPLTSYTICSDPQAGKYRIASLFDGLLLVFVGAISPLLGTAEKRPPRRRLRLSSTAHTTRMLGMCRVTAYLGEQGDSAAQGHDLGLNGELHE